MKWEHFPCPIALISEIYEIGRDYTIEYYLGANGLISRRLTPAYRSRTDKWRMTDDSWTNKRWTNIGNQAYPWPLKWISWNTEIPNRYRDILKYRYRIPNRLEKIPTKIPNTDTDVKYRHRPMTTEYDVWRRSGYLFKFLFYRVSP